VSVGDFVWLDADRDGIQDDGEKGIKGVELRLVGPDGQPVRDVDGDPVGPVKTGDDGGYLFEDLPVLGAGESYKVCVTDPAGL
ncbi:SdrD B-like domain-containing protein, partial [Tessaracoccus sp. OH4464_COT-324]|uniref:SdrD B-like domain-containing protein n=1 Tax=Tessaracoccus sp. OH4464_COT-324 TaxID=2491059 RepID=UPI000FAE8339